MVRASTVTFHMTVDIVIPGTPDVTVRGSVAVDGPRFADLAMQVGGFVFDSDRKHISSLRWVPSKEPPYTHIVASLGGDELRCTPSAHSLPFIAPHLTGTISVLLILSGPGGTEKRYDLGDYTSHLTTESDTTTLVFRRTVLETTRKDDDVAEESEPNNDAPPPDNGPMMTMTVSLEDQYRRVFGLWGIDGLYDILTFHVPEATEAFRPMAMLFEVLGDVLLAWCGSSNRCGPSVLAVVQHTPPIPSYFTYLRSMARILRFPVLLGHGYPLLDANAMQQSVQMLCILFRPGDGAAQHVRFMWDESLLRMVIVPAPHEKTTADTTTVHNIQL